MESRPETSQPLAGRQTLAPEPGRGQTYTCPMHPEVIQTQPGACPICGMALEAQVPSTEEETNPDLEDMRRRFWISLVLTTPVFLLSMSDMIPGEPVHQRIGAQLVAAL